MKPEEKSGWNSATSESSLDAATDAAMVDLTPAELLAFESELRKAMPPIDLPAGFADRIVANAMVANLQAAEARSAAGKRARVLQFRSWRLVAGGAIAACLLAGFFGAENIHERHERQHAATVANQQFETATRITDEALEHTREQLRRAGVDSLQ